LPKSNNSDFSEVLYSGKFITGGTCSQSPIKMHEQPPSNSSGKVKNKQKNT